MNRFLVIPVVCLALSGFSMTAGAEDAPELIEAMARGLDDAAGLDPIIDAIGGRRYALLGEASHGTSEYYRWRAKLSQRLIEEKGFRFIAVEGDWALCHRVNRYIKGIDDTYGSAREALETFDRWPQWMWANEDIVELVEWLRDYNDGRPADEQVGFYGIDVYDMDRSIEKVNAYLDGQAPELAEEAAAAYACFEPYEGDPQRYAQAIALRGVSCDEEADAVLALLRENESELAEADARAYFAAKRNAHVVRNAERHYRAMLTGGAASWNTRVDHFFDTVEALMDYHGEGAKGIVWAHNTHIGDARATDMARDGRRNIGQLVREAHGEDAAFLVGFATHRGRVLAGRAWEAPVEEMEIPPAMEGSLEDLLSQTGRERMLLLFDGAEDLPAPFHETLGHRAVGVVYNPAQEHGNYVPTETAARYDALLYFEETEALTPLH